MKKKRNTAEYESIEVTKTKTQQRQHSKEKNENINRDPLICIGAQL